VLFRSAVAGGVAVAGATTAAVTVTTAAVVGSSLAFNALGAALAAMALSTVLSGVTAQLFGPKMPKAQASRLNATLEPQANRKFVFGETAMNTDIRYYETSGTDQEYFDYIIATAAHEVEGIDEIWFDDEIAWTSSSGIAAKYSGYLTINTRTVGTSGNTISINGGGIWGSSCRLTGCSYIHVRLKRTGNDKKAESPLVNGLPGRLTIKGRGAKLYDPRLDSTVSGGSGSHRANDQTTWGTANVTNRDNPALQLLWFLLGWDINSKLSVGCGIPYQRIDLPSFITAANICDEAIALAAGGTQPRYRTAGVGSDADTRMEIIQILLSAMNATLRDSNGKLALTVMKNDLATPVLTFDDDDVLADFSWNQTRGLDEMMNAVHGKYTDPSNNSLYQPVEYPTISITSIDGIERMQTFDLPWVQDGNRAQRIAKQVLQRAQYKGVFSASFTMKALGCEVGDIVYISFGPLGWSNKPFRVLSQGISNTGQVPMTLIEENAAIYAWDAEEQAVVTPTAPTVYDPLNSPLILGTAQAGTTANWSGILDDDGNLPENNATRNVPAGTHTTASAYLKGDFVTNAAADATYIAKIDVPIGIALTNTVYWSLFVQGTGTAGQNAISAFLTNQSHTVATASDGSGGSYTNAGGTMRVFDGATEKTTSGSVTYAKVGSGTWYSINSSGVYTISDPGTDSATAQFDATYAGVTIRLTYSIAKSKAGSAGAAGPALVLTTTGQGFVFVDNVLTPSVQSQTFTVVRQNVSGTAVFTTSPSVPLDGSGDSRTLTAANFGTNKQVTITATVGTVSDTITVVRLDQSTAAAGATVGAPAGTNVGSMTATDISARVSAAIDSSGLVINGQVLAERIAGTIADAQIAALAANKLTGQITQTQITDNAISTQKLEASAVTTAKLAVGAVQAGNIATATITSNEMAANSITATQLAAGSVTANKISVSQLDAITATIGLLRTATSGARMELESNQLRVYNSSNVLVLRLGIW